jgi:hypothetical protein
MRCADSEPTARNSPRDGPATVPLGLRSGLARGATYERRRNTIRVAKEAGRTPIVLSRRTLGLLLLAALLAGANAISQLPRREMTGPQPEGTSEEARG